MIGSGVEHEASAEEVGRLLAERGATVVCGGLGEVMAAAARGAKSGGRHDDRDPPGRVAAPTPTSGSTTPSSQGSATRWNLAVVASGDAVIAVGGRWGTLAEIGFATGAWGATS